MPNPFEELQARQEPPPETARKVKRQVESHINVLQVVTGLIDLYTAKAVNTVIAAVNPDAEEPTDTDASPPVVHP